MKDIPRIVFSSDAIAPGMSELSPVEIRIVCAYRLLDDDAQSFISDLVVGLLEDHSRKAARPTLQMVKGGAA